METWYLIIILVSSSASGSGKAIEHIPFANEEACVSTRNEIQLSLEGSRGIIMCKKDR